MLYLRTFGDVQVTRTDAQPLGIAAQQRRLVALLALLSSGERLSRDRVLALLWPDGDPERSRHALTQAMYHARRTLHCDELFLPGTDIRLNPDVFSSDVVELQEAMEQRDYGRAASIYGGPFLDDFHVPGSSEFERWASQRRMQFDAMIARAYDALADAAQSAKDVATAISWRQRRLQLDPLSTDATRALVEALLDAGDHVGALRQLHVHEALLRSELDASPDQALRTLEVRARSVCAKATASPANPEPPPSRADEPTWNPVAAPWGARTMSRFLRRAIVVATGAVAGSVAVVGLIAWRMTARAEARSTSTISRVMVAPFSTMGADRDLAFLHDGIVELLAVRLGEVDGPTAVDPGAVIRSWRAGRLEERIGTARTERIAEVARRLGATSIVTGSVVGSAGHVVITASLTGVRDTLGGAVVTVAGQLDSLAPLIDRLTGKLLILSVGEGERFEDRATPSLRALRAYVRGQAAYRRGDFVAAIPLYAEALGADGGFSLAAMHLALAADRINSAEQHDRALAIAWANRSDLNDADRAHLEAFAGPRYPQPSSESEQLAAWQRAVSIAPDRAEAWRELGERLLQFGAVVGVPNYLKRGEAALKRAISLDPSDATARQQLILVAVKGLDTARLRALASQTDSAGAFLRWRVAMALRDSTALRRIRAGFGGLTDAELRAIAMSAQFDGVGLSDAERALRLRARRPMRSAEELDQILAQHSLALNQDQAILALDFTEQLEESQPGNRAHLRLRVLDAIYGGGDVHAAEVAARELARVAALPTTADRDRRAIQLADACVVGQWQLHRAQPASVSTIIAQLRAAGVPDSPVPVGTNPHTCAALLEVGRAVAMHGRGAAGALAHLDSLIIAGPAAGDANAYAHLWMARMWERVGNPERALHAIRRRPYLAGWPRYERAAQTEERRLRMQVEE